MSDNEVDNSYALMFYDPAFTVTRVGARRGHLPALPRPLPERAKKNDPKTGDVRYDDPVLELPWGTLPEGYCRNYADANTSCPWRFDDTPPDWSPTREPARPRLLRRRPARRVDKLDYLSRSAITAIYFNPIFDGGSNHRYDTQDYYKIDPYFGNKADWDKLVKKADKRGIRLILDGVFNHMSSDSPLFDRYSHYKKSVGACESLASPWRPWFTFFNDDVPCGTGDYAGWFGFDSIPVITKSLAAVQEYFLTGPDSVSRHWLKGGGVGLAARRDGRSVLPRRLLGELPERRQGPTRTRSSSASSGRRTATLLRHLRGDRADSTMNYRLRDAVLGLLSPSPFDSKGFGDSGHSITASEFAARLASIREDYPDAAYYSLLNLLDSHDTERILWTLTPGDETTAGEGARTRPTSPRASAAAARLADPVHGAGRADRLLRRRGRRHGRRRPGRPPHVPVGGSRRQSRRRPAEPLQGARPSRKTIPVLPTATSASWAPTTRPRQWPTDARRATARRSSPSTAATKPQATYLPVAGFLPDGVSCASASPTRWSTGANADTLPPHSAAVFVTGVTT